MQIALLSTLAALAASVAATPVPACQRVAGVKNIPAPVAPLKWSDWNFLSTTDTHGYQAGQGLNKNDGLYSANWADFTTFVRDMKRKAEALDVELFVTDSGDIHDGSALADNVGNLTNGVYSTPMILKTDYDVLALGNHELYQEAVARDMFENFGPKWNGKYLASNTYIAKTSAVDEKGKPTAEFLPFTKYRYFQGTRGSKVLAFGWMFNFTAGITKFARINPVQEEVKAAWFLDALNQYKDADFVLMAGHMTLRTGTGIWPASSNAEWQAAVDAIRKVLPTTPIVIFGGHRHVRDYHTFGPNTYALSAGRYMETVGFLSISKKDGLVSRRYINSNLVSFNTHLDRPIDFALGQNSKIGREINEDIANALVKTNYSVVYGCAPQDYYLSRVPSTDPSSVFNMLGKELAPALTAAAGAKATRPIFAVINGGGTRYDIFKGEFTVADAFNVIPFTNIFQTVRAVPLSAIKQLKTALGSIKPPRRRNLESSNSLVGVERRQNPACTYKFGYVTNDTITGNGGERGDDIQACPFPFFNYPSYVFSPSTLPDDDTQLFDVLFYDFINKTMITAFQAINYTIPATFENYIDAKFSSLSILPSIASTKWKC
ncbi:hypothetical protein HDU96_008395 [Phlyctochytrium bullatum]|nr:hypothetical protein HDU96_008395 [Phlyctochytrium bullatum]